MFVVTPECFTEIVLLGVYWQQWPPQHQSTYTTVDHVLTTFKHLNLVTADHIRMIQHPKNGALHQRRLMRYCGVSYGSEYVTNNLSWLLCLQGINTRGTRVSFARLVRNQRLMIHGKGVEVAPTLESRYAPHVTQETYLRAVTEIRAKFEENFPSDVAKNNVRRKYLKGVEVASGKE